MVSAHGQAQIASTQPRFGRLALVVCVGVVIWALAFGLLRFGNDCETIVAPDFVLRRLFRLLDPRLKLGPVALVGQVLMHRGYTLTLPAEKTDSELMHAVNRARQAQGLVLVPVDSALAIHRVIRDGGVLGILADRAVTGIGERVEFFGRTALLPSAHVALALRTGAALVPAFTWRENGLLHARIEEPLVLAPTGDREADVRAGVRQFAAVLERYIKEHPEQWTVFRPVWDEPTGRAA